MKQNTNDINSVLKKQEKTTKKKRKVRLDISILTFLLIIFAAYLAVGVTINSAKIYSLHSQIMKLNKINKIAVKKNQYLREELEKYTSNSGVEALARNRLQFSKDDETLVIIKNTQTDDKED